MYDLKDRKKAKVRASKNFNERVELLIKAKISKEEKINNALVSEYQEDISVSTPLVAEYFYVLGVNSVIDSVKEKKTNENLSLALDFYLITIAARKIHINKYGPNPENNSTVLMWLLLAMLLGKENAIRILYEYIKSTSDTCYSDLAFQNFVLHLCEEVIDDLTHNNSVTYNTIYENLLSNELSTNQVEEYLDFRWLWSKEKKECRSEHNKINEKKTCSSPFYGEEFAFFPLELVVMDKLGYKIPKDVKHPFITEVYKAIEVDFQYIDVKNDLREAIFSNFDELSNIV